jgi:hypothetical protein
MRRSPNNFTVTTGRRRRTQLMITRKSLGLLAALTLVLLTVAGTIGQKRHGVIDIIGRIAWWSFVGLAGARRRSVGGGDCRTLGDPTRVKRRHIRQPPRLDR